MTDNDTTFIIQNGQAVPSDNPQLPIPADDPNKAAMEFLAAMPQNVRDDLLAALAAANTATAHAPAPQPAKTVQSPADLLNRHLVGHGPDSRIPLPESRFPGTRIPRFTKPTATNPNGIPQWEPLIRGVSGVELMFYPGGAVYSESNKAGIIATYIKGLSRADLPGMPYDGADLGDDAPLWRQIFADSFNDFVLFLPTGDALIQRRSNVGLAVVFVPGLTPSQMAGIPYQVAE